MFSIKHFINRTIIPKSLYVRSMIILILPIIILQVVLTYIFYNRHLDSITQSLSRNLAASLSYVADTTEAAQHQDQKRQIVEQAAVSLDLKLDLLFLLDFEPGRYGLARGSPMRHIDDKIIAAFEEFIDRPFVIDLRPSSPNTVEVTISLKNSALYATIPKHRVTSTSTQLLLTWMMITALIVATVAVYYMKLQVAPIRRLARAVSNFGKGRDDGDFRPEGPLEVRRAAQAFNRMRRRILRHIGQRTELLAAVSHDLRTPLTRMRLGLEFMESADDEIRDGLNKDIVEMEELVELYLSFARGEGSERVEVVQLAQMVESVSKRLPDNGTHTLLYLNRTINLPVRPLSFRRCIANIIENARTFGTVIRVTLRATSDQVKLIIEDNGPGVGEDQYDAILKPFVSVDSSKSSKKPGKSSKKSGGVGLGLAIAHDIVLGHGGELALNRSDLGGLKVTIKLPS